MLMELGPEGRIGANPVILAGCAVDVQDDVVLEPPRGRPRIRRRQHQHGGQHSFSNDWKTLGLFFQ